MQVKHGGLELRQFNSSDAHCPNITEVIVATFSLHSRNLWSHPVRRSDEALPFSQSCCDLGIEGYLNLVVIGPFRKLYRAKEFGLEGEGMNAS